MKMNKEPLVVLAMPTKGELKTVTYQSILNMLQYSINKGIKVTQICAEGTLVPLVRSTLIQKFLEIEEATHLLFVDSDMVFERDALLKLLAHKKEFVSAIAKTRSQTGYNAYRYDFNSKKYLQVQKDELDQTTGLVKVDAVGMAFCLIEREVLEIVNKFRVEGEKGEDILFCEDLKKNNVDINVDFSLRIGHLIDFIAY